MSSRTPRSLVLLSAATLLTNACGDDGVGNTTVSSLDSTSIGTLTLGDGDGDETASSSMGDGDGTPGDGDGDGTPGDGDGTPGDGDGTPGDGDGEPPCPQGEIICENGVAKECDGMGGFTETPCADECVPELGGCVLCIPGTGYCNGDQAFSCDPDGMGHTMETCDGLQGIVCDPMIGECGGDCDPDSLGTSYIGCDYYPTVTPNPLLQNTNIFAFAVAVANTTNNQATVTVTKGANMVSQVNVAANSVQIINLPWVNNLRTGGDNQGSSKIEVDGAYRLRSTAPVTVYQYNPLQYTANGQFSYTNDASLLSPATTWGNEVRVVSWNYFATYNYSAFYAVVASEDGTQVTLSPSATGAWVKAGAGVMANGTGNVNLNSSDVLIVFNNAANQNGAAYSDPSGTLVTANKPIQVIGGHVCPFIPQQTGYCDHLEETIPPIDAVGKDYFVTAPLITANSTKARMVRITATEPNTTLTYDPPQNGAPGNIAAAGGVVTINATSGDFRITSPNKILVSEYMQGQDAGGNKGDPAMTLAVPVEQYRTNYLIHAPTNYSDSYANIVAPNGAQITVDGNAVGGWFGIGGTGYSIARVVLSNAGNGNHTFNGNQEFGIQVYGYGQYTSYWYPGGQDLNIIPQ